MVVLKSDASSFIAFVPILLLFIALMDTLALAHSAVLSRVTSFPRVAAFALLLATLKNTDGARSRHPNNLKSRVLITSLVVLQSRELNLGCNDDAWLSEMG